MDEAILALSIPIIAIVFGCSIPLCVMFLTYRYRRTSITLIHQQRMACIEKGIDPGQWPEFLDDNFKRRPRHPRRTLRTGLILLFVGLGVAGALFMNGKTKGAYYGLIPSFVGLALLTYYSIAGKRDAADYEKEEANRRAAALQSTVS